MTSASSRTPPSPSPATSQAHPPHLIPAPPNSATNHQQVSTTAQLLRQATRPRQNPHPGPPPPRPPTHQRPVRHAPRRHLLRISHARGRRSPRMTPARPNHPKIDRGALTKDIEAPLDKRDRRRRPGATSSSSMTPGWPRGNEHSPTASPPTATRRNHCASPDDRPHPRRICLRRGLPLGGIWGVRTAPGSARGESST